MQRPFEFVVLFMYKLSLSSHLMAAMKLCINVLCYLWP